MVNSVNSRDVKSVIVDGKLVMKNRVLLNVDEEKSIEYVHKVVERLWDRLLEKGEYQIDVLEAI